MDTISYILIAIVGFFIALFTLKPWKKPQETEKDVTL